MEQPASRNLGPESFRHQVQRHVADRPRTGDAGGVDDAPDRWQAAAQTLDERRHRGRVGDISGSEQDRRSLLLEVLDRPGPCSSGSSFGETIPDGPFRKLAPARQHQPARSPSDQEPCHAKAELAEPAGDQISPFRAETQTLAA